MVVNGMKIVIVGYGRVGSQTARVLAEEGYEVSVAETVPDKVERAREQGLTAVEGDGSKEQVLMQAGLETADAVGGFTGDPDTNYTICQVASRHSVRTVMRISEHVSDPRYDEFAEHVDDVIDPERLGAAGAKTALLGGDFGAIADLTEQLGITVLQVPAGAPIVGSRISRIDLGERGRIYAHGHSKDDLTIPLPATHIEANDRLAVIMKTGTVDDIRADLFGIDPPANG